MAIEVGNQPSKLTHNYNEDFLKIKGDLDDYTAKTTLAKFLRYNLAFTSQLILGIDMEPIQTMHMNALFLKNNCMFVWSRGAGKTVKYSKDTLLLEKTAGLVSIDSLIPNVDFSHEGWVDIPTKLLWNGNGWQQTDKIYVQPQKNTINVETRMGYSLEGSTVHKIQVLDTSFTPPQVVWKNYTDVSVGDYVCISRNKNSWGDQDENEAIEAYKLGLLFGDGSFRDSNISFTSSDKELVSLFDDQKTPMNYYKGKTYLIKLNATYSNYLRGKYSFKDELSYDKHIPDKISSSSLYLSSFLRGLFDTDGTANKRGGASFSSSSYYLAKGVHNALLSLGVVSSIKEKKSNSPFGKHWTIDIVKSSLPIFIERVGFGLKRKNDRLLSIFNKTKANTNIDIIPGRIIEAANSIKKGIKYKKGTSKWRSLRLKARQGSCINATYDLLERYLLAFSGFEHIDSRIGQLRDLYDQNFFYDPVISKTNNVADCLDFNVPDGAKYWSNGFISHNSTVAGWYCILKCIFEPGTRIVIASANFRTSRRIFEEIVRLLNTENAQLARACFDKKPYLRNDKFQWDVNGGYICAIPLSEDTRGMRCDVLILDELLLLSPMMINDVLSPFLSSPRDAAFRIKVRRLEDDLIKTGALHPNNRLIFENCAQMIGLSSASYTFQHLYKMYADWSSFIDRPDLIEKSTEEEERPTYFLSQLSWEAVPGTILNREFIQSQKASVSHDSFAREYGAQFRDGADGYYSMKKMNQCTIPDGEVPHTKVVGDPLKKYILSIDPSYSKAQNADYYAMAVMEIDEENDQFVLVHGYQVLGADLQDHVKYMYYVMTNFNIVLIVADAAHIDATMDAVNDSELFKSLNKKITYISEWNSTLEGQEYVDMLEKAKKQYSTDTGCMCIRQTPSSEWIMRANSYLQSCIDHKKIWFASRAANHPDYLSYMYNLSLPMNLIYPKGFSIQADSKEETRKLSVRDHIEKQDDIINDTKEQCANIEVTQTARGHQSFDLPKSARSSTSVNKPRKDNYSALVLGAWGVKCYNDLANTPMKLMNFNFVPVLI